MRRRATDRLLAQGASREARRAPGPHGPGGALLPRSTWNLSTADWDWEAVSRTRGLCGMVMPDIELRGGSQATVFEGARIQALAVGVPEDNARFEGQVVAFVDELLEGIEHGEHLRFCSSRGETYTIAAGDLSGFALLSTNAPSWKLVPAGRAQLAEITVPRFLLRDVESIELHAEPAGLGTSDQVFTNLSDALQQPTRVRFLSLTSARLESFPTGVFELTELESLNLGKNRIEELPAEIGELRGLKVLKLSRNRLTALPNEIGRLKQLEELHLSRNGLVELPEKLWNLESLRFMNLGRNKLRDVPQAISRLGALRELELDHNKIPKSDRARIQRYCPGVEIEW